MEAKSGFKERAIKAKSGYVEFPEKSKSFLVAMITPMNESSRLTFSKTLKLSFKKKYPNKAVINGRVFITSDTKSKGRALTAMI